MRTGIQLCYPFSEKRFESWGSKALLQPKLNGERCRVVVDSNGKCTLLSSEENIRTSVPHINSYIESLNLKDVEFDGELYVHGMALEKIHSIVSRKNDIHPDYKIMEITLFDIVSDLSQTRRITQLENTIRSGGPVNIIDTYSIESMDDLNEGLDYFYGMDYEGIILRRLENPYVRKRSTGVMKLKPVKHDSYVITGYKEECDIYGVPKGTLGALFLKGDDATVFGVGTGPYLTDEHRRDLWKDKEGLIGKIAYIKYKGLTDTNSVPKEASLLNIYSSKEK